MRPLVLLGGPALSQRTVMGRAPRSRLDQSTAQAVDRLPSSLAPRDARESTLSTAVEVNAWDTTTAPSKGRAPSGRASEPRAQWATSRPGPTEAARPRSRDSSATRPA